MNWYLFLYNPIFPAKSAGFMKLQQSENNSETWAWEAEQTAEITDGIGPEAGGSMQKFCKPYENIKSL